MVGVAVNVTLVPSQIVVAVAAILTLAGKFGYTVMAISFETAGDPAKHGVALLVITTVTSLVSAKELLVNVEAVSPETSTPLICHWYVGLEPPLVGVAVKVTLVPGHIEVALDDILTLAVNVGLTVIVMLFDVAGEPVKQGVAFEVITAVTTSLFAKVEVVNVEVVTPTTLVPFTFH